MIGLTKINQDWIPLQVKVFSRWVSNQLKNIKQIEVRDISKDLSNGVALVELATVLTNKQPKRGWSQSPKLKVEMVQNCDLALDMFTKDGVNFVGISGKDISDNNQKLILGLIWTLILHYSVSKSINNNSQEQLTIQNEDKNNRLPNQKDISKTQSQVSSQDALISWANKRIENYPNVHNFTPYDLSLCALLDTYFPQKINYYSLNPQDSEHNSRLATKVMEEAGIPIYVYPDELQRHDNSVDEKTLLTQLSSAKFVLDDISSSQAFKQDSSDENDNQNEINEKSEEVNRLSKQIISLEAKIDSQKAELTNALEEIETQKAARIKAEENLINTQSQVSLLLKQIYSLNREKLLQNEIISNYENELDKAINENAEKDEQIARLNAELEKANNNIKDLTEKANTQSVQRSTEEYEAEIRRLNTALESSESYIENKENEEINNMTALGYFTKAIEDLQSDFDQLYIQKIEDEDEIQRLRYALDMAQIEIDNERDARQENEFELENLQKSQGNKISDNEAEAVQELRVQSLLSAIDEVEKSESKAQSEVEKLESEILTIQKRNKATIEAYSDAVESALHEAKEEAEDCERAEKKVAQLSYILEHKNKQ